ncbi:MAG: competence/damage-inducible protein A [Acidobacteriota bacterium]
MKACIIAVGSEMLTPFRIDTNSLVVTERLNAIGCDVRLKLVVGDDIDELARAFAAALEWAAVIVVIGGLGPTDDDITRQAVARVLQLPLEEREAVLDHIRQRFARRGLTMQPINARQALAPRGATILDNPNGTAPGLWLEQGKTAIVMLPGPPREMTPMFEAVVRDRLAPRSGGAGLFRRVLRLTGRTESDVDAHAAPVYGPWASADVPIATTILATLGQIELHLTARAPTRGEADIALDQAVASLAAVLGPSVYSTDGRPLEAVVGSLLRARHMTVAVAESCTGGLLMSRLTDVAGSSDYVDRGFVCYSNRAKTEVLDVPAELIAEHGAVSEPVARAMAEGARRRAAASIGVAVTGIAGPGGGTAQKPVGTTAVAIALGDVLHARTFLFPGGRDQVKFQASQAALNELRLLLGGPDLPSA